MRNARVWQRLLGLVRAVIESIDMETDPAGELLVVAVRPRRAPAVGMPLRAAGAVL